MVQQDQVEKGIGEALLCFFKIEEIMIFGVRHLKKTKSLEVSICG